MVSNPYRQDYLDSIYELLSKKQDEADYKRTLQDIKDNPEKYRAKLIKMLGWPLTEYEHSVPNCKKEFVTKEDGINVYRMQFEILNGIKFYGIYFEHDGKKNMPLVISQHGGEGTPEACSGIFESSTNYNEMTERALKKGLNVFAPQLLLWHQENYGIDYNRQSIDVKLKQVGSSIASLEIYCIMKAIDFLSAQDEIDSEKIGMIGLSYGGFYTLYTTAIDTRIKAAISCSWYNDRYKYSRVDWEWFNSANELLDNDVCMLVCPRYLCVQVGDNDEIFTLDGALKEYEKLKELGDGWLDFLAFEGVHEFYKGDEYIDKLIKKIKEY